MSWLNKIDKIHDEYFKLFFKEFAFEEYEEMDGNGMGGLRKYSNRFLKIKLLNDRGIFSFEISSIYGNEDFIEFPFVMKYLLKNKEKHLPKSKLNDLKNQRFSLSEQVEFININWIRIVKIFSEKQYQSTNLNIYDY